MKFTLVLLILGITSISYSQENGSAAARPGASSGDMRIVSERNVPFSGAWAGKARCDDGGNLYVHLIDPDTRRQYGKASRSPISRIKPDGSLAGTFKITDVSPDLFSLDFFVTGDGKLFQAATSSREKAVYVVLFDNNGSFKSKIRLEAEYFVPYQIVAFPRGEFLLSGTLANTAGFHRTPFTAVFDSTGTLIKRIYEPEDEESRQHAAQGDPELTSEYTATGNTSVWHGDAVLGSDGNAYLLRATSPALIYVISPRGEVIRKLRVESPGAGLKAQRLKSSSGRLAIGFIENASTAGQVKIVDFQGKSLAQHASQDRRTNPGLPSCYNSSYFTFLSADEGSKIHVHKVEAK
jgi:hypothetical protein